MEPIPDTTHETGIGLPWVVPGEWHATRGMMTQTRREDDRIGGVPDCLGLYKGGSGSEGPIRQMGMGSVSNKQSNTPSCNRSMNQCLAGI